MKIDRTLSSRLKRYLENYRTRKRLRKRLQGMPARELDRLAWEIGVSRAELLREAHSPFWKNCRQVRLNAGVSLAPEGLVRLF